MGKKALRPGIWLIVVLLFVGFSGCKKKNGEIPTNPVPPAGEIKGDLKVLSATPKGTTRTPSESQAIVVIFDHPMVALEALPEGAGSSFLKVLPAVPGKHRWLGARALVFTPDTRLPYSTPFEATVPAGTCSRDGFCIPEGFTWRFNTVRPRVLAHFPAGDQKSVKPDTRVLLVFNQPVSRDNAGKFIAFTGLGPEGREAPVGFDLRTPSEKMLKEEEIKASPQEVLLVEPVDSLRPDSAYRVEIKAGLPAAEGPLGSDQDYAFQFETFKTFRFVGMNAAMNHNPHEPLKFQFSNPVSYKRFIQAVRFEPEVAIPDYYAEWDSSNPFIWLNLPLEPEMEYAVRVSPDLEDEFGNRLGNEVVQRFRTAPFPPSISMTTGHGVIEAYSDPLYPFYALNTTRVFVQAANVPAAGVIPLLSRPRIFWTNEKLQPGPGFYGLEKALSFKLPPNKRQAVAIDLKSVLPDRSGLVFVQLDTGLPDKYERFPKVMLQVTELGISAKFSPENNVIWVSELRTGLPVAGAEVEVRDDANAVRWQGKTDESGRAETSGWKELGIKGRDEWSKPQQWVFARRGKDVAFTSSELGTGIDPYRFRLDYDWNPRPETVQGHIFTERGIYRAGETVHIKGIIRVREKGTWHLPKFHEVMCEVQDPFQKSVHKGKASLDEYGSFAFDLDTSPEASLGNYQVLAVVPPDVAGDKPLVLSDSFRVEAFRPAEFEVHLRTPGESFVFGDEYRGEVRANYLSGGAMSGQKAAWFLRLNPSGFTPPGRNGFLFGNEMDWEDDQGVEESRLVASGEAELGDQGLLEIKASLVAEKEKDSVMATLEATVQSPSRNAISNRIQTTVHRGEFYIGLQPSTSFLEKGKSLSLNVIAVDPQGRSLPGKRLKVKLVKREWRSVRQAGVGRRFRWHTEKEDIEVSTQNVETKEGPAALEFVPEKSGLYLFAAEGKDGRDNLITTSTYFYVTGKDYVSWEQRDDDTIELVADRDRYAPGETARVLVKSPYEKAKALVTIERELVIESQVLEIQGSSSRIEIPIKPEYMPNVFVSVLLIQGRTEQSRADERQDIGKPSFKMGYVKLSVSPFEKMLKVDIARDKKDYKPKEKVSLSFKVRDSKNAAVKACLSLAVVDVGVLNLIGYQTPDPFGRFYGEKPLSIQTSETRLHVVGRREYGEKGEDTGGGGEKMLAASPALTEVELRGDFKSTAFWNPSLITNDQGEAGVTFELPANLTSFRVMAVAQTADSEFGRGDDTFRVSKPLQLQPSLPRFARSGDKFEAGAVVRNLSDRKGTVNLEMEARNIICPDASVRTFELGPGEAREVLFPFQAESPGLARLAFRARMGEETDGLEIKLPVQLPRPTESVALSGQVKDAAEERIRIPGDAFLEESFLDVQASPTALSGLKGSLDYLKNYPYLCLEQRLSAVLPYLVASKVIFDFKLSPMEEPAVRKFVHVMLRDVYGYQKEEGAFGLWPDGNWTSPYLTCYSIFALVKAREAGYEIDASRLDQAAQFLVDWLREDFGSGRHLYEVRSWKTTRAFALYDLALLGRPEPAYAEKLFAERDDLPVFGRALLLKALHYGKGTLRAQNMLLDELLNMVKVTPADAHFEEGESAGLGWVYSSNLRTTAFVLQTLIEIGSDHPLVPQIARWIVDKRRSGHWHSTQENFYVFYALNDFFRTYEKERPDFAFKMTLDARTLLEGSFKGLDAGIKTVRMKLSAHPAGKELPLAVRKDGDGTLYYTARMTYAPGQKLEARDEGISVLKHLESLDGKSVQTVKAGSLVVVAVDVVMPQEGLFIVVDDPLPAGFEAVNPSFLTESEEQLRKLDKIDEGDERWWEGFHHVEMRDDRVLLFADSLTAGLHTHRYLARALTFGTFLAPGTKVEEMYSPEVFGRGAEQTVAIEK
jgi:uncharacterized protein YfaS (alpha-2-macroglobulin family)